MGSECSFCKLSMPHREIWSHEKECGSKTEKCDSCGLYIRIRDLPNHGAVCGIPDKDVAPPSYNYGDRGLDDWGAYKPAAKKVFSFFLCSSKNKQDDDYLLCPQCQQPFERLDDLQ